MTPKLMAHTQDSQRMQRGSVGAVPVLPAPTMGLSDFMKLIEELRSLKNRSQSLDLAKLEDQHLQARDTAIKAVEKKAGRGASDDILRLQAEAKKIIEAEHEQSKAILTSKFQKIETGLAALARFLQELGPVKDIETRAHEQEGKFRKMEDELRVQRKVLAHEQEELEREKGLFEAQANALNDRKKELEAKFKNLEVVQRAKELDQQQQEFEEKVKAFDHELAQLERERNELNKDFDKMGEKRNELEDEKEKLASERADLGKQKAKMADVVAKEMALTFESFVRDMLRNPSEPATTEEPPKPAPPAKASPPPKDVPEPESESEPEPKKGSDFWQ